VLNGLAVGGGANFVGPSKVGNAASAFDYFWSDPYYLLSAHVSFTTKIFDKSVKWQLNAKNLLNESDPVTTGYTAYREGGANANPITYVPGNYRYNDPRQIILTASVKF
jgi:outer membrane receptor for monomeric catechols